MYFQQTFRNERALIMSMVAGMREKYRNCINPLTRLEISGIDKDSGRRFLFVGTQNTGEWRNNDGLALIRLVVLKNGKPVCGAYRDARSIMMAFTRLSCPVYKSDSIALIFHDLRKGFVKEAITVVRMNVFWAWIN